MGTVTPPPSKSLSHRSIICAALAAEGGVSEIQNLVFSDDVSATLGCLESLGAAWEKTETGVRIFASKKSGRVFDCGESGSTLRFLLPVAALTPGEKTFTGHGRLMDRPLEPYLPVFEKMGISLENRSGSLTLRGQLKSGTYSLPGNVSSQFVSGLLFALPLCKGGSELAIIEPLESRAYVSMTVDVMKKFGVAVENLNFEKFIIPGGQCYNPGQFEIEADFSQAAYFLCAAALGRNVACQQLNQDSLQGDREILSVLAEMGADMEINEDGSIRPRVSGRLKPIVVDAREIPDIIPPIAVLCCFAGGTSQIINAGRLRLKESDRLHALASELSALGADITEDEDSLTIKGSPYLIGGRANAHNDHRIAMSIALAAIKCRGTVELIGSESVQKSFPNFWEIFCRES